MIIHIATMKKLVAGCKKYCRKCMILKSQSNQHTVIMKTYTFTILYNIEITLIWMIEKIKVTKMCKMILIIMKLDFELFSTFYGS